ncbi:MAG: hypothetical protein JWO80_1556 [Bryobacterales bacterium]|nr:hypothetical protein [Bryobacterales bacterium]
MSRKGKAKERAVVGLPKKKPDEQGPFVGDVANWRCGGRDARVNCDSAHWMGTSQPSANGQNRIGLQCDSVYLRLAEQSLLVFCLVVESLARAQRGGIVRIPLSPPSLLLSVV